MLEVTLDGVYPTTADVANGIVHQHRRCILGIEVQRIALEYPQISPGLENGLAVQGFDQRIVQSKSDLPHPLVGRQHLVASLLRDRFHDPLFPATGIRFRSCR